MRLPTFVCFLPLVAACTFATEDGVVGAGEDTGPSPGDTASDSADSGDTATDTDVPPSYCEANGFGLVVPWDAVGPYGENRRDLAADVSLPLAGREASWTLSDHWTGCDSYLFIRDNQARSTGNEKTIWTRDLDDLIAWGPRNVHYFFVTEQKGEEAEAAIADMVERVESHLGDLAADEAAWWAERVHVVGVGDRELDGWIEAALRRGIGQYGLGIDRFQRLRGIGSIADVNRYDGGDGWPFENNMAYSALEAVQYNVEAERQARLDVDGATVVPLWTGEVISEYADMEVDLPSAAEMAAFDTFEIDIDMRCPDAAAIEASNCGAWDYFAAFYVQDGDAWIELSRFITTYHREAHWVADATPMMAHLLAGGTRTFRWSWAPSWNVQPTATRVSLRFSNQGKGYAPRAATLVATGGSFGSGYNTGRVPVDVAVSDAAQKVELWALITGHGMGTNNCAEFCNHQHDFTVNGEAWRKDYPMAQTADGCVAEVANQATPNQWGTWWYGRGGWCPGQLVAPFSVDLSSTVAAGGTATVSYQGSYEDGTPPDGSGDISMNAWVVVYE